MKTKWKRPRVLCCPLNSWHQGIRGWTKQAFRTAPRLPAQLKILGIFEWDGSLATSRLRRCSFRKMFFQVRALLIKELSGGG